MKLLFISNFYPPASRGGYELWCQEIAENFKKKNHDVMILTSKHGKDRISTDQPNWVRRDLYLEMELNSPWNWLKFFTERNRNEHQNLLIIKEIIKSFSPDFILVWGMWNLSKSILEYAEEEMAGKVVYYMGDYWPSLPNQLVEYWGIPGKNWITSLPKRIFKRIALNMLDRENKPILKFSHVLYPTKFMRDNLAQKGYRSKESRIIPGAIDTSVYTSTDRPNLKINKDCLSLLYVGRLTHEKGVHTAIQAVQKLVNDYGRANIILTILGSGEIEYETYLHNLVRDEGLQDLVEFAGSKDKDELPGFYQKADMFLFTSIWPEPFGRVIVEAMASGVPVIGSATGGASEILINGKNSLVFQPGNSEQLAKKIIQLIDKPDLRQKISECGRNTAVEKYDIKTMAAEIEEYLTSIEI